MCQFISFYHNPATGEVRVHDLNSHAETEQRLKLDLKVWREGHYLPGGKIDARVAPEDHVTSEQCAERIRGRWLRFAEFFNWCIVETNQTKLFGGGLDLRGCDLKGVKLPEKIGGGLNLRGCKNVPDKLPTKNVIK